MAKNRILPLTIAILLFSANLFAQISIKSLPFDDKISADQNLFGSSQTRIVKILNHNWKVYWEKNPSDKISTTVPSSFSGENKLVYETTISFSEEQLAYNTIKLCFLGLNYSCEILVNNYSIFKRSSGEIPFDVELPSDLLKADTQNKITIFWCIF